MKLMIINPDWGMTEEQMEQRCRILADSAAGDTQLSMRCLTRTRVQLDSMADIVLAGPEILQMTVRAEQEGYDAVILYCFSDPALEACRQAVSIPVVGAGQAACLLIPVAGYQGAILVADPDRIPEKKVFLSRTGLSMDRICGYEAVQTKGLDPVRDRTQLFQELRAAGQRVLGRTGAQVLVLGCLSFLGLSAELEEALLVPVIDPGPAGVCLAESLVRQKLCPSKKAYRNYQL